MAPCSDSNFNSDESRIPASDKSTNSQANPSGTSEVSGSTSTTINCRDKPAPHRLENYYISRLQTIADQYKSMYIFVREVSLYEVALIIIRASLAIAEAATQATRLEAAKVRELCRKYCSGNDSSQQMAAKVGKATKRVTLAFLIELLRASDVTGQVLHFAGLSHLWSQHRSIYNFTKIAPQDIVNFHYFIVNHFQSLFVSHILDLTNPETAILCLLHESEYTSISVAKATNQVDQTIISIVFAWLRTAQGCEHASKPGHNPTKRTTIVPLACSECTRPCWPQELFIWAPFNHNMMLRRQHEALGRIYLNDYLHRWYVNQINLSFIASEKQICKTTVASSPEVPSSFSTPKSSPLKPQVLPCKFDSTAPNSSAQPHHQSQIEEKHALLKEKKRGADKLYQFLTVDDLIIQLKASAPEGRATISVMGQECDNVQQAIKLLEKLMPKDSKKTTKPETRVPSPNSGAGSDGAKKKTMTKPPIPQVVPATDNFAKQATRPPFKPVIQVKPFNLAPVQDETKKSKDRAESSLSSPVSGLSTFSGTSQSVRAPNLTSKSNTGIDDVFGTGFGHITFPSEKSASDRIRTAQENNDHVIEGTLANISKFLMLKESQSERFAKTMIIKQQPPGQKTAEKRQEKDNSPESIDSPKQKSKPVTKK